MVKEWMCYIRCSLLLTENYSLERETSGLQVLSLCCSITQIVYSEKRADYRGIHTTKRHHTFDWFLFPLVIFSLYKKVIIGTSLHLKVINGTSLHLKVIIGTSLHLKVIIGTSLHLKVIIGTSLHLKVIIGTSLHLKVIIGTSLHLQVIIGTSLH